MRGLLGIMLPLLESIAKIGLALASPDPLLFSMNHMRVRAGLTGQETRDILAFILASKRV